MKKIFTLVLSICTFVLAHAQSFTGTYTFASVTTTTGTTDPTPPPTATGLTFGAFSATGTPANPNANGRFSFVNWPTGATNANDNYSSLTGTTDPNEYYEVTLSPAVGYSIALTGITFTVQRSGFGIRTYSVRSSLDNFATNLTASVNSNTNLSVQGGDIFFWNFDATTSAQNGSTITLGAPNFNALTAPVTFRFYGWNSESGTGTFSIDNVVFAGTATALQVLADFSASPDTVCEGLPVSFTDASQSFNGPLSTWSWNFGDVASGPNNNSSLQNPTHTFSGCGTYTVTLIVTNSNNNSDTTQRTVNVLCNPVPNFTVSGTTGCAPYCAIFTDQTQGSPSSWSWDFGDPPPANTQNAAHCFVNPGFYTVSLTVTQSNGCTNQYTINNLMNIVPSPVAGFSFTPAGLVVAFADQTTGGTPAYTYTFDPGDGSPPTPFIPSTYTYPFDNTWTACLYVTDASGCTDSVCHTINIVTTGMKDDQGESSVSVFPNPSYNGMINVGLKKIPATVSVFNAVGGIILKMTPSSKDISIDLSKQDAGIYFIQATGKDGNVVTKKISLVR
ncbi:MAG TPA: PKD domain-containing protein [Bacteroidia bacterium]|jgi:PKD repeat protein